MAGSETTSSKRAALRFSGYNIPLSYKTDYEDGEALLINISTIGCAISETTTELLVGQKILIILNLDTPERPLQVQAVVLRVVDEGIGLKFQHQEEHFKRRLVSFFAKETRRHKNEPTPAS